MTQPKCNIEISGCGGFGRVSKMFYTLNNVFQPRCTERLRCTLGCPCPTRRVPSTTLPQASTPRQHWPCPAPTQQERHAPEETQFFSPRKLSFETRTLSTVICDNTRVRAWHWVYLATTTALRLIARCRVLCVASGAQRKQLSFTLMQKNSIYSIKTRLRRLCTRRAVMRVGNAWHHRASASHRPTGTSAKGRTSARERQEPEKRDLQGQRRPPLWQTCTSSCLQTAWLRLRVLCVGGTRRFVSLEWWK